MFDDSRLQCLVENQKALRRKYGDMRARRIGVRIAALHASSSVLDLRCLPGRWHPLAADRAEHWAGDLDGPYRLMIRPAEPVPRLSDGGVDWGAVTRIVVVSIEDYH